MKTENQSTSTATSNQHRSGFLSIPTCAASAVLKSFHTNNVTCQYRGLDQSGHLLMEIGYVADQQKLIDQLCKYMENSERFIQGVTQECEKILEKLLAEQGKTLDDLKQALNFEPTLTL